MSNVVLNPGVGGATCATDTIGGVDFQKVKINIGAAGADGGIVNLSNPLPVIATPQISGGYSTSSILSANSINATVITASQGQLYGVHLYNHAGYEIFVKFYNKGSSVPAPATDAALLLRRIAVQAGTSRDLSFASGIPFSSGIGIVIVKGIADTDVTAVLANDCIVDLEWH